MPKYNYDVVLDVRCKYNRDPQFRPLQLTLRSEKNRDEARGKGINTAYQSVNGVIPGERVMVDMANRKLKIVDRMTLPENREKDIALRTLADTSEDHWNCKYGRYKEDREHTATTKDWPTWLYHLRRMVDTGKLTIVRGSLPTCAECVAMGTEVGKPVQGGLSCDLKPSDPAHPFWEIHESDVESYHLCGAE